MADLARLDTIPVADIPAALGELQAAQVKLQLRYLAATIRATWPTPKPQPVDRYVRIEQAAKILGRSTGWMQKNGHTLPGYEKPNAHCVRWSERALRDYARQTVGAA